MEAKRHKKGRKHRPAQQPQHHPWDEVSLPGAGTVASEQPTILVINQVNGSTTKQKQQIRPESEPPVATITHATAIATATVAGTKPEIEPEGELPVDTTEAAASVTVAQKAIAGAAKKPKLALNINLTDLKDTSIDAPDTPVVLIEPPTPTIEIESHLIEDVNSYVNEEAKGIGINELQPIEDELVEGASKVETDANVRTVIEVEPAGAKIKQIVEILAPSHQTAELEHTTDKTIQQASDSEEQAVLLIAEAQETTQQAIGGEEEQLTQELVQQIETVAQETTKAVAIVDKKTTQNSEELVKDNANNLINEIESEAIETLSQQVKHKDITDLVANSEIETETEQQIKIEDALTKQVDAQLFELTSILKSKPTATVESVKTRTNELKIIEVPTPKSALEEEQRKEFIDSLPQIEQNKEATEATRLAADCKREYYQSLKKYLIDSQNDKPPVPLQTYRWEDLRRAKERGGYPWTHLYKRPLGPDEEPEIVLLLRKSQELRFKSESPKSLKKVRYDEQVLVKETERYIEDLSDDDDKIEVEHLDEEFQKPAEIENQSLHSESISCVSDSVLAVGGHAKPRKTNRLANIRNIIRRRRSGRTHEDVQSLPGTSTNTSRHSSVHELAPEPGSLVPKAVKNSDRQSAHCFPMMKKLKNYAERQKKRLNIKRIPLKMDEKIILGEKTKILKLKSSPKSDRGEIPHFIEKQDSDDVLEIVEYDESPSRKRNKDETNENDIAAETAGPSNSSIVQPDEVIELQTIGENVASPPKKTPRLRREHLYEEISQGSQVQQQALQSAQSVAEAAVGELNDILTTKSVETLKKSLSRQDHVTMQDIEAANQVMPLDRMGSSEEEQVAAAATVASVGLQNTISLLAPISSIDSTSSEEERARATQLSPVDEESDVLSDIEVNIVEQLDLKPTIKKEASPAPSDKKVTFSHVEDEAEPHREDIELPDEVKEAVAEAANQRNKLKSR